MDRRPLRVFLLLQELTTTTVGADPRGVTRDPRPAPTIIIRIVAKDKNLENRGLSLPFFAIIDESAYYVSQ